MAEHIRYARNRREFLTDCFCGAGSLAFASMLAETQARAARYNPLAPKPPHMPDKAKAKAFIFVYIWVRGTLPRFRYDQLMAFGWKFLLPLAIANILVTALIVALK